MDVFLCRCGGTLHLRCTAEWYTDSILYDGFYECDICGKRGKSLRDFAARGKNSPKRYKVRNGR